MQLHPLPARAVFLAPLTSMPVFMLAVVATSDAGIVPDVLFGLLFAITMALPLSFLGVVLVGLPLFILLRQFRWVLLAGAIAAGVAVPCWLFQGAPRETLYMGSAVGLVVSVSAWLLRPRTTEDLADD